MSDELLRAIHQDLRDVKLHTMELVKQGAIANQTLIEHERRSTNLETRLNPIEKDYVFKSRLISLIFGSGSVFSVSIALYALLK